MKRKYKIYPKEGEILLLDLEYFEFKEGRFILYNERINNSDPGGFLSLENIAAIVPDQPRPYRSNLERDPTTFRVYLKNRPSKEPLTIQADTCDANKPPYLIFSVKAFNNDDSPKIQDFPLRDVFVALSEVLAVVPDLP